MERLAPQVLPQSANFIIPPLDRRSTSHRSSPHFFYHVRKAIPVHPSKLELELVFTKVRIRGHDPIEPQYVLELVLSPGDILLPIRYPLVRI